MCDGAEALGEVTDAGTAKVGWNRKCEKSIASASPQVRGLGCRFGEEDFGQASQKRRAMRRCASAGA